MGWIIISPPHKINYRANVRALKDLGVERVMASFAIGSINPDMPPLSLILLDQFLDFTSGRSFTFFEGGESGLVHTDMTEPYCQGLRVVAMQAAREKKISRFIPGERTRAPMALALKLPRK